MRTTPCLPSDRIVSPSDPLMENPWTQRTNGPASFYTRGYLRGILDPIPNRHRERDHWKSQSFP